MDDMRAWEALNGLTWLAVVKRDSDGCWCGYPHDVFPDERERDIRRLRRDGWKVLGEYCSKQF